MTDRQLDVAIIGMGGFAGDHHRVVLNLERKGECRLRCTCDPQFDRFHTQAAAWEFSQRGVAVHRDFREMLEAHKHELDLVSIPTPIPLHAAMHRACVTRGLACYLEKPPTLYWAELDEMIAADEQAPKRTHVGFSFIVEDARQVLKQRVVEGEFGQVRRVCFFGYAPRATAYFRRADWAGRLMLDGGLVLDSCIGNALAHYVHNLLFWAGERGLFSWAPVASVRAEVYRAHDIEGADTFFVQGVCGNGVEVWIAATHACEGEQYGREWVECENATISQVRGEPFRVAWKSGTQEEVRVPQRDLLAANFRSYFQYLRGEAARPLTSLADSRPFVVLNDLAYLAARRIVTIPREHVLRSEAPNGAEYVAIDGIRSVCETFLDTGRFPSEQGVAWGRRAGQASSDALAGLVAVVRQMSGERAA